MLADLRQKPHSCAGRPCLAACVVLVVLGIASPALAAQVSPRVLAAAQAFWAEHNQGQSPCSSVTVTYFDGPVLATDEPLHNGEASIGYPASSFHGAPVSQPCDLRFSRLLAGRSLAYECAVAAHEIGHAGMGLEHTSDRTTSCSSTRSCRASAGRRSRSGPVLGAAVLITAAGSP